MTPPGKTNGEGITFAEFRGKWIEQAFADKQLPDGTFRFLVGLAHHYLNSRERRIWAAQGTMADHFGISLRSVNGHLAKLVCREHLEVRQKGRDTPNDYFPKLHDTQVSAHQSSASRSADQRHGNSKTRKSASDDTQDCVPERYADLRTNTLKEHFEEHRGSPPDGGSPQCHSSILSLEYFHNLPDDEFISPDAAKAARADIIEFLIQDAVFKIEAAEVIGNLLDRGALTKRIAHGFVDRVDEGADFHEILDGLL